MQQGVPRQRAHRQSYEELQQVFVQQLAHDWYDGNPQQADQGDHQYRHKTVHPHWNHNSSIIQKIKTSTIALIIKSSSLSSIVSIYSIIEIVILRSSTQSF